MNSIFGHGSVQRCFLSLQGVVGLVESLHHHAVSRIADQITAIADRIDGRSLGTGIDTASESHGTSALIPSLLVSDDVKATGVKAHCLPPEGRRDWRECAFSSQKLIPAGFPPRGA